MRVLSRTVLFCAAFGAALAAAGCGGASREEGLVVAAFYPLAFAAERVAPTGAEVANLTPPGAEPHDLELTARDVERLRNAALVVYAGGGFQPAVEDALAGREGRSLDVVGEVDLLPGVDATVDPHVWLDPLRYATVVRSIARALGRPEAAEALVGRLRKLDGELARGLESCERREIVTSHAAFAYLADRSDVTEEMVRLEGHLAHAARLLETPRAEPVGKSLDFLLQEIHRETNTVNSKASDLAVSRLALDLKEEAEKVREQIQNLE